MTTADTSAGRLLRSRNFGPYFFGNAASASGTWFQNLAASILVYQLTHSPFLLGVLNFCQFVPSLVLAPWAGTLADRFDRRRLVLATQLISSVLSGVLAAFAFAGEATELSRLDHVLRVRREIFGLQSAGRCGGLEELDKPANFPQVSGQGRLGQIAGSG